MMDQEITTCPQCGATVLAPARFCVTCGIKLPDTPSNQNDGEPVDPRAGWNTSDRSGWTTPPPGAFDFEDPTIIDVEPIPVTTVPPVSRWGSWPDQPARTEDEIETPVAEAAVEEDVPVEATTPAPIGETPTPPEIVTSTPAPWTAFDSPADEPIQVESEIEVLPAEESADPISEITPADVDPMEIAIEAVEEATDVEDIAAPEADDELADDFEAAGWTDEEEIDEEIVALAEETEEDAAVAPEPIALTPGIERANALLDELRAILPGLAAGIATQPADPDETPAELPTPTIDLDAIKSAAVEARGEISFDNFSSLRTTIDEATTKPRDVEVMLKLSQRVDDIFALIAERDRLQQAFDVMLERLTTETPE
ncbi:MAG: hypothetical protein ACRDHN_03830 [Thermomicrobiales bacterium]